ncbi:MAG: hypothetical protein ACTSO5_07360, partial [Candidatus Heimdallarchaeaceae archaeon]
MAAYLKESIRPIVRRLIEEAWEVREGEKLLIISDYPTPEDFVNKPLAILEPIVEMNLLAKKLYECILEIAPCETELYFIKPTYKHYKDPNDEKMSQKIAESDIVLTLTQYSLTDVPSLAVPLKQKKIRHISAPLIPIDVFFPGGPLDVDLHEIERLTTKLFSLVQGARKLEFFDIAGSYLSLEFKEPIDWLWESGFVTSAGMFSNLPAGEITLELPYMQNSCIMNGTLNIFPGWSEELTQLLTLTFKDSKLVEVSGGGKIIGEHIKEMIKTEEVRIVQMGVGTNPQAKDPFCA